MRAVAIALLSLALAGCGGDSQDKPAEPRLVVAMGDSITAGTPGWDPDPALRERFNAHNPKSQWEYWAQEALGEGYEFRNCGVPGDRTDEILARVDSCLDGADVVVLQGGINDLIQRHPPEAAVGNMRAMVERVRKAGVPVVVANALPVNRHVPGLESAIARLNRQVAGVARAERAEAVDFHGTLEDPPGSQRMRRQWTTEGIHPSIEGYKLLGTAAASAIRRALRAR